MLLASVAIAETYVVKADTFGWVDDTAQTLMTEAIQSNNKELLNQLIRNGQLFLLNKGDKVIITDMGFLSHTVYIVSGNYEGQTCIVATGNITRSP